MDKDLNCIVTLTTFSEKQFVLGFFRLQLDAEFWRQQQPVRNAWQTSALGAWFSGVLSVLANPEFVQGTRRSARVRATLSLDMLCYTSYQFITNLRNAICGKKIENLSKRTNNSPLALISSLLNRVFQLTFSAAVKINLSQI